MSEHRTDGHKPDDLRTQPLIESLYAELGTYIALRRQHAANKNSGCGPGDSGHAIQRLSSAITQLSQLHQW